MTMVSSANLPHSYTFIGDFTPEATNLPPVKSEDPKPSAPPLPPSEPLVFEKLPGFPSVTESFNSLMKAPEGSLSFIYVRPPSDRPLSNKPKRSVPIILRQGFLWREIPERIIGKPKENTSNKKK
jgi:hypothetical protein